MALEGKLTWKGIDIDSAYVVISNAQCNVNYDSNMVLKTEATYNEDGSIKTEALYEKEWTKSIYGHYNEALKLVDAYKDLADA
mgnify:CR=1 FL=1